jgi:hypothetical protein
VERDAISTLDTGRQQIDRDVIGDTIKLGIGAGLLAARNRNLVWRTTARSPESFITLTAPLAESSCASHRPGGSRFQTGLRQSAR